jgi:hypothetical protein
VAGQIDVERSVEHHAVGDRTSHMGGSPYLDQDRRWDGVVSIRRGGRLHLDERNPHALERRRSSARRQARAFGQHPANPVSTSPSTDQLP